MLPLLVRITNTQTGESQHLAFANSPVRIGRNQLNELFLNEPFVSQWHAVVRFDEHKTRYVDLGSTNGTTLNGRRVARHIQVEVDPQVDLRIGPIQLAFARAQVTPDMYATPRTTIFDIHRPGGGSRDSAVSSPTIAFNPNDPETFKQRTLFLRPAESSGQEPHAGPGQTGVDVQQLLRITEATRPAYDRYREAWGQVLHQLRGQIEALPPDQREGMVLCLCQQFPQLSKEPAFRELVATLGLDPAALGDVDATDWIKRLGGRLPVGSQINTAVAMERVGAVLESFSQAFVELRKGYEQFGEEMALRLVQDRSPLHDARDGGDVLRYLLDWTSDGGARVRELTRAFADLALHQVALLNGVMEGARSLLGSLSPTELSGHRTHALAKAGGGGLLERLFNANKARHWARFVEQHERLVEEDRFSRSLFGRDFARAYFMVAGGHLQGDVQEGAWGERTQAYPRSAPPPPYPQPPTDPPRS